MAKIVIILMAALLLTGCGGYRDRNNTDPHKGPVLVQDSQYESARIWKECKGSDLIYSSLKDFTIYKNSPECS